VFKKLYLQLQPLMLAGRYGYCKIPGTERESSIFLAVLGEEENVKANYFGTGKTKATICRQGLEDTLGSAVFRI
jgi:hypothetical protein